MIENFKKKHQFLTRTSKIIPLCNLRVLFLLRFILRIDNNKSIVNSFR